MKKILVFLSVLALVLTACSQGQSAAPEQPSAPKEAAEAAQPAEPAAAEDTASGSAAEVSEPETPAASGGDVIVQEKGVFEPESLSVKAGSSVVFSSQIDGKTATLQVWEGKRALQGAAYVLKGGDVREIVFDKAGIFQVKTLEYGTSMDVAVE